MMLRRSIVSSTFLFALALAPTLFGQAAGVPAQPSTPALPLQPAGAATATGAAAAPAGEVPPAPAMAEEKEPEVLAPELREAMERALSSDEPRDHVGDLWRDTILRHGTADLLIDACEGAMRERMEQILFESEEDDPSLDTPEILALRRLASRLSRVLGDLTRARQIIEKIPVDLETIVLKAISSKSARPSALTNLSVAALIS